MSAFIVHKAHIDALVYIALYGATDSESRTSFGRNLHVYNQFTKRRFDLSDPNMEDVIGRTLWTENLTSVAYRYPQDVSGDRCGPIGFQDFEAECYTFPVMARGVRRLSTAEALKAIHCLEYQSCEHEGWVASDAHAILDALTNALTGSMPGYNAAEWCVSPLETVAA